MKEPKEHAPGELAVLGITAGDQRYSFNTGDPEETKKAGEFVKGLIRQGYAVFVEVDGKQEKVTDFDPSRNTYIIGDKEQPAAEAKATAVPPTSGG